MVTLSYGTMVRLSRAQTQQRNRDRVLAAAFDEFTERGFRDAKIDVIAERAELTRGAVYSNFPGKRALYFAVLAREAEHAPLPADPRPGHTAHDALGAFARAWVTRAPALGGDLLAEIAAEPRTRRMYTQLMRLSALLLALALEHLEPPLSPRGAPPARLVRTAETVLTTLSGARQLAVAAPGFAEPFDVISACERLAGLRLNDWWAPPHVVAPVRRADEPWDPPSVLDAVRRAPAVIGDGVVAVLGLHRVAAVEEAVRADSDVTAVLVTGEPAEYAALARLVIAETSGCLREAFPVAAWPRLRVVCDEPDALAAAAGVTSVSDDTEAAVTVRGGRVTAHAEGRGACHSVAIADRLTWDNTTVQ